MAANKDDQRAHQLSEAANKSEKALQIHEEAERLKAKAAAITDPAERARILDAAVKKELEASGLSRAATRLQQGYVQGAIGGAGIGAATAAGVGAVVGTVVGGVLSVPTTLVGGLVGTGVGALHGPFIKLPGGQKKQAVSTPSSAGTPSMGEPLTIPDPKNLREAAKQAQQQRDEANNTQGQGRGSANMKNRPPGQGREDTVKKKPRKIEVRR